MVSDNVLLLFTAAFTNFHNFFNLSMRMHLIFFNLFFVFLFFYGQSAGFSFEYFGNWRFTEKVLYFLLVKNILFRSSLWKELDCFLNKKIFYVILIKQFQDGLFGECLRFIDLGLYFDDSAANLIGKEKSVRIDLLRLSLFRD